ncbi:MAG: MFS transporter [Thermoprotei archaeon]
MSTENTLINRLERFESWPWPLSVLVLVGVAYFFGLYDVLTLGVAAPAIASQLKGSATTIASVGTVIALVGYLIGAVGFAHIADKYGRKTGLTITLISYSLGSLLTGLSTNIPEIYFWRFITGIGIGADLAIAAAYLSELTPAKVRGRFQSLGTFFGFVGAGIGPLIGLFVIPVASYGWRIYFIIGALGGLAILYLRRSVPESPRWLIMKKRLNEAENVIGFAERNYQAKRGALPPISSIASTILEGKTVPIASLFTRKHLPRLILMLAVFLLYYVYAYPYLALTTSFLAASGYAYAASLTVVGLGGLGFALGAFLSFIFSDLTERKYLVALLFFIQAASMIGIGLKGSLIEEILSYFVAAFSNTFLATMLYVYSAENFPTRARSNGVALTDGLGHLAPIFSVPFTAAIFAERGLFGAFEFLAIGAAIGGVFVLLGIRSTRRVLEEISE